MPAIFNFETILYWLWTISLVLKLENLTNKQQRPPPVYKHFTQCPTWEPERPCCYFSCWEPLVLKITNSELHIFQRRLGALFFRGGCLTKHSMWWISSIHQTKFEWNMSSNWKIFVNNRTKKLWNLNDEKKNVCKCTTLDWEWGSAESEDLLKEIFSLPRIGDTGGVRFGEVWILIIIP